MNKPNALHNSDEYEDPNQYDVENDPYLDDIPFLEKWASRSKGYIIDLACGTGRVTIPLASKGYKLIGVDLHRGMLDQAIKKSADRKVAIEWIEQDCTELQLNAKSTFIYMVGNSFQHFLSNEAQNRLLSSVNRHLEAGGIFIFNTRFPSVDELLQPTSEEFWRSYSSGPNGGKVDVSTISNYDALEQIQHYTTIRTFKNIDGDVLDEKRTNISLRYVFPKEMERLLSDNGFEILHMYKDWNENPITNDSYGMVYVCRKRIKL